MKTRKWTMVVFYWVLESCVANSSIIWKKSRECGKNYGFPSFKEELVGKLLTHAPKTDSTHPPTTPSPTPKRKHASNEDSLTQKYPKRLDLTLNHTSETMMNGTKVRRVLCAVPGCGKKVQTWCPCCKTPLCKTCFLPLHATPAGKKTHKLLFSSHSPKKSPD
eukprot:TRINITY_DN1938_c0_g1_i11.p1 TRINITY_DN1938_c0_g1~~TRINITY_DN1938_c0_g1_i11.p1  ORF type:complete len:163 (+),score=10.73 TRINITY_DN1938_c0_g1_i11:1241-1729(+)